MAISFNCGEVGKSKADNWRQSWVCGDAARDSREERPIRNFESVA